jgi:hypothetical protein
MGTMTAHLSAAIVQSKGNMGRAKAIMVPITKVQHISATRNRTRIFGTSTKKLDRSTSFLVAPQVILYENMCARIALVKWIDRPPKNMKLQADRQDGVDKTIRSDLQEWDPQEVL